MRCLRNLAIFLLSYWISSPPAMAQACAMCRTGLLGYGPSALQAMNWGIVLLLIPPVAIGTTIIFFAFHRDPSSNTRVDRRP